jgi:phosphoglycolate phosphatase-like HAD superfamily hydrolase
MLYAHLARTIVEAAMNNLIIFDLDGVITSEEAYWDSAGLTLHEMLYAPHYWNLADGKPYRPVTTAQESRHLSRATFPETQILSFKARALNSNWDTCYATICLHLIALLSHLPASCDLRPFKPWDAAWLAALRDQITREDVAHAWDIQAVQWMWSKSHPFDLSVFHNTTGLELFTHLDTYASQVLGYSVEGVFSRHQPFWRFCQDMLQAWHLGEQLYTETYRHLPAQLGKPGCIFFEQPLLPVEQIRAALGALRERGYILGIASGRVYQEAAKPLQRYGLLDYFDGQHIATYDVVEAAEQALRESNVFLPLGKPHAFQFMAAADRTQALAIVTGKTPGPLDVPLIAVGDSTSDILSGRAAGALTVAVLTGARTQEARKLLLKSQPDFVIDDMTQLPELLTQIEGLPLTPIPWRPGTSHCSHRNETASDAPS